MESIKISVIVPVYNVETYLNQCIESIINQTLKDIEIIFVNDGSTDKSREILDNYRNDSRITIIDKENEGSGAARNAGLNIARGNYIYFIDSDDYIERDMLEKLYNLTVHESVDIVQCGIRKFYDNSDKEELLFYNENSMVVDYNSEEVIRKYLKYEIPGYVPNKIIKRDLFINNNLRFPEGFYYEDMLPTLKMFRVANKVIVYKEALYNYRQRDGSISKQIIEKNIVDYINQVNLCLDYIETQKFQYSLSNEIITFKVINYLNAMNWYMKFFKCDKKIIRNNYHKYFENFDVNDSLLSIVRLRELKRSYKIIYILQKLNIYRLFIKWGIF